MTVSGDPLTRNRRSAQDKNLASDLPLAPRTVAAERCRSDRYPANSGMPSRDLENLQVEARHARDRFQLYRAKLYGSRAVSLTRPGAPERGCGGGEGRPRPPPR